MVVELHPIRHELRGFAHRLVAPKSQLLVFDASPEALDKHVVLPATFTVHPDLNTVPFDCLYPFRTRKLRALICIKNLGLAARPLKSPLESSDTKFSVHGVADLPREHRSAMPVHDRNEVTVSLWHRDIDDVGAPHLINFCHSDVSK